MYREYVDLIYRFVFFKVSDRDLAWDITQECFLRMWRQCQDADIQIKNNKALLYKIARNLVIDYWRQKDQKQTASLESVVDIIKDDTDLFAEQVAQDEIKKLLRYLDELPAKQKEIMLLRYVDDLSYQEIAEITGKTALVVRVSAHRAIKVLKKIIPKQ